MGSKFESNSNPCLGVFKYYVSRFSAPKIVKNCKKKEYFRGKFYENHNKMRILEADFMKIVENCTKMTILEADL